MAVVLYGFTNEDADEGVMKFSVAGPVNREKWRLIYVRRDDRCSGGHPTWCDCS